MLSLLMPLVWIDPLKNFMNPSLWCYLSCSQQNTRRPSRRALCSIKLDNTTLVSQGNEDDNIRPDPFKARQTSPALAKPGNRSSPAVQKIEPSRMSIVGEKPKYFGLCQKYHSCIMEIWHH